MTFEEFRKQIIETMKKDTHGTDESVKEYLDEHDGEYYIKGGYDQYNSTSNHNFRAVYGAIQWEMFMS